MKSYTANKSRTQGRESYSIIFRHPVRKDSKGKTGLRIRRGLGTSDSDEAEKLVDQMNELLNNESLWNLNAKPLAKRLYDPLIITAFYDSLETSPPDYWDIRGEHLPLPSSEDGYARIQFVGTTGAGKTTLLRQIIGSDPKLDKFPSTSAAKTTISDLEIITAEGSYNAIVTFFNESQTRLLVEECVAEAVINSDEGGKKESIARRLLTHKEQRFRLNYILGDLKTDDEEMEDDEDSTLKESQDQDFHQQAISESEKEIMRESILNYIKKISEIADLSRKKLDKQLDTDSKNLKGKEQDIAQELFEDLVLEQEEFNLLVDEIMDEIQKRFIFIQNDDIKTDRNGWPEYWKFNTENRDEFIRVIRYFSSNFAPMFGRLLTPLVQGIRIKGPLYPKNWSKDFPKLVLMDGQGLGHTPDSAQTLPTSLTKRFSECNIILLVDNAKQPMQAASLAVLRSIGSSGNHTKLAIAFTHFDLVSGDNLLKIHDKKNHVLNSLTNSLTDLKKILGSHVIRSIERDLEKRCFFLGHIQDKLSEDRKWTRKELNGLLELFKISIAPQPKISAKPIYDITYLFFALQGAIEDFRTPWSSRLGLKYSGVNAEHWTRIKALSRRFSLSWDDEYDSLRPVADLIARLTEKISLYLDNPVRWEHDSASEEEKQQVINTIRQGVNKALHTLVKDRLDREQKNNWMKAFGHRGQGSTKLRSQDIEGIFEKGAPLLSEVPSPNSIDFLPDVVEVVNKAIDYEGGLVNYPSNIQPSMKNPT
jgi:signal recognition particle receptor subunit beta